MSRKVDKASAYEEVIDASKESYVVNMREDVYPKILARRFIKMDRRL